MPGGGIELGRRRRYDGQGDWTGGQELAVRVVQEDTADGQCVADGHRVEHRRQDEGRLQGARDVEVRGGGGGEGRREQVSFHSVRGGEDLVDCAATRGGLWNMLRSEAL